MYFAFRSFGAPDLARRGLTPASAPPAVLLLDVEAELSIVDDGRPVWSEPAFPVAELARGLAFWLRLPEEERGDFAFDSVTYDVPGAVRIAATDGGWRVGSVFAPDAWSSPCAWPVLARALTAFTDAVRSRVIALGADPHLVPAVPGPTAANGAAR
ncbi:hypothetical protein KCH_01340 [Kitasatospora cheerisanensis KCTC 2395]|uniref:DUF7878 domain-containing protein n=1 Tax=Kitasatospora cheerisanensis KCTC 2395 TaxID=1348663 RepID=A0A066Z3G5_9ACTN|nr:hypothetical protein KCH_01340 [Kitasatospora cheerisanensis KCTC 2395]